MPYRPTERTKARKAETRERIVSAALQQLADGGYPSASVQAVARRADVATGTVYRHFASKSELFAEVFRRASQREVDAVAEAMATGAPASVRLAAGVRVFARRALRGVRLAWPLLAEPADPAVEAERPVFRRAYRDEFAAVLAAGVEAGDLPAQDAELVADALVGAIGEALVGPLSPASAPGAPRDDDALVEALVTFCLRSVSDEEPADVDVRA